MAKTTDTRGKTKTTKKKPATAKKASGKNNKTVASKTAQRRVSVAALFKRQGAKKRRANKTSPADRFRKLHIATAVIFAALAAAAVFFMQEAARQLSYGYLGRDALASQGGSTVFAPAWQPAFEVGIKWLLVALLVLSIVLPVLYVTKLQKRYVQTLKERVNTWRWVDLGVTGSLMVGIIALLSGVSDLVTLELIMSLVVVSAALAWVAETRNAEATANRPELKEFAISAVIGALPWLVILGYAVNTVIFGTITAPWYVYALYAVGLAGLVLFLVNQWFQHKRRKQWADYAYAERNYLVLNLAVKALFATVLIIGFLR